MTPTGGDPRTRAQLLADELANARDDGFRVRSEVKARRASTRRPRHGPYDGPVGRALADVRRLVRGCSPECRLRARIDAALTVIRRELPADVAARLEAILTGLEDERGRSE